MLAKYVNQGRGWWRRRKANIISVEGWHRREKEPGNCPAAFNLCEMAAGFWGCLPPILPSLVLKARVLKNFLDPGDPILRICFAEWQILVKTDFFFLLCQGPNYRLRRSWGKLLALWYLVRLFHWQPGYVFSQLGAMGVDARAIIIRGNSKRGRIQQALDEQPGSSHNRPTQGKCGRPKTERHPQAKDLSYKEARRASFPAAIWQAGATVLCELPSWGILLTNHSRRSHLFQTLYFTPTLK